MKIKEKLSDIWYTIYNRGIRRLIPKYQNRTMFTAFFWRTLKDRMLKGYDESELWSLDYSLTKLIAPRMRDFAKDFENHGGGIPSWLLEEEYQKAVAKGKKWDSRWHRMADKHENKKCWKKARKRWTDILNAIADGFEDMKLENEDWTKWTNKWKPTVSNWQKKLDKAKTPKEKQEIWNKINSWREYRPGIIVSTDDIVYHLHQNATDLLSKHFHDLWT